MAFDLALTDDGYNAKTARYGFTWDAPGGDVSLDETQAYAVAASVLCKKNRYWADSTHGTELSTLKNATTLVPSATPSQAEAMALDGLAPLEPGAGNLIAADPTAAAKILRVNGLTDLLLKVAWTTPGGQQQSISLKP